MANPKVTLVAGKVRVELPFEDLPAKVQERALAMRATYKERLAEAEADKERILSLGRKFKRESDVRNAERRAILDGLRVAREAQGLSLGDIEEIAGFGKAFLSRLETDSRANPTVDTLQRYAEAVGKTIVIKLVDSPGKSAKRRKAAVGQPAARRRAKVAAGRK